MVDWRDIKRIKASPDWLRGKRMFEGVKHPGNKNQPKYNALTRRAVDLAQTTGLQDPASGPGGFLQGILPEGKVQMNEYDPGLFNLLEQIQNTEGGLTIPYDRFGGSMDKNRWMDEIRGSTITQMKRGEIPFAGDPMPSLNHFLSILNERGLENMTPEEKRQMAIIYYINKHTGSQGGIRIPTGLNNNTAGALKPFFDAEPLNLLGWQNLLQNTELRQGDATDALREWDIDRNVLAVSDPPYEGEPSVYSDNWELQAYLKQLEERMQEGQPILAFDSWQAAPFYADMGFEPQQIMRRDTSGRHPNAKREPKFEMVAAANIPGFDARSILSSIPKLSRFVPQAQKGLLDYLKSESQNAFESAWGIVKS